MDCTIKGRKFYAFDYLISTKHPALRGAKRGVMKFIEDNGLVFRQDYRFISNVDGVWRPGKKYSKRYGLILFSEEWLAGGVPKESLPDLPPILKLEEHEMFCDADGDICDVEVRGERHFKKCFFKVADVAYCFGMENLSKTILKSEASSYQKNVDYVMFDNAKIPNVSKCTNKISNDKTAGIPGGRSNKNLYLTYHGLIRVICVSRTGTARSFLDWMMEVLFAAHLGTEKQKAKTASRLLGVDYPTVLAFCSTLNTKISAVYLMCIGKVGDLRTKLDIPEEYPDGAAVYKYGRTDDIKRRFKNHIDGKYSEKNGYQCQLITMWFIDKARCPKAEHALKKHLDENGWRLDNKHHNEIAIFDMPKKGIIDELDPIFSEYASEIRSLEHRIAMLESENTMLRKDIIILEREKDIISCEKEILEREKDILKEQIISLQKDVAYRDLQLSMKH